MKKKKTCVCLFASLPLFLFPSHLSFSLPRSSKIQQRAEHNDGVLHSLEELSLNQLGLLNLGFVAEEERERGEGAFSREGTAAKGRRRRSLLPRACRKLRHLSLAGNSLPRLPCGPRDLGLCKELKTLNVALNAIERIEGGSGAKNNGGEGEAEEGEEEAEEGEGPLSSCESLKRLDLSGNFISKATVREALRSLASAPVLESLWLSGCPVTVGWGGDRKFVVASLPRLRELVSFYLLSREFFFFFSYRKKKRKKRPHVRTKLHLLSLSLRTASPSLLSSASRLGKLSRSSKESSSSARGKR